MTEPKGQARIAATEQWTRIPTFRTEAVVEELVAAVAVEKGDAEAKAAEEELVVEEAVEDGAC